MFSAGKERENEGPFTFQVILRANGDIEFAYESIPLAITTIQDEEHPVKVGLSDAYIIDRTIFCKYLANLGTYLASVPGYVSKMMARISHLTSR